ncbi:MAG TPA: hypothetical protein VG651_04445 [Stellaceae bacterium]|nr:hypothetical protein [Stellaceae bacterium]
MAKSAPKRPAKPAAKSSGGGRGGGIKPVLLAAGLGLYWFVEYQDLGDTAPMPMWGYATAIGVRLLADFVGAWLIVSALRLVLALGRLGFAYLRGWMAQQGAGSRSA